MILLDSKTVLQLVVSVGGLPVDVNWVDLQGQGAAALVSPIFGDSLVASPGATTIAASPPATTPTTARSIQYISIVNNSGGYVTVTVQKFNGSMATQVYPAVELPAGYGLIYNEDSGWDVIDTSGRRLVNVPGPSVSAGIAAVSAGTQFATSGTIAFANSNGLSFGMANSSVVTASYAGVNVSAGTTSNNLSALTFSNGSGVSFGLDGSIVTAQVASSLSNINVSAGTTSANVSAVTFSNANNVSFGFDGSNVTAAAAVNVSAGTTSNHLSAITFSNSNNVSFGLAGSVVTASASAVPVAVSVFSQDADFVTHFPVWQAALSLQKLSLPADLMATQLGILAAISCALGSSGALTVSHGVYTMSAGTAALASSASRSLTWGSGTATTATSLYGGASGTRYRTVQVNYAMTPGDYLFAWAFSTENSATVNVFGRAGLFIVGTFDGIEIAQFLNGTSVSSVTGLPAVLMAADTGYARTGLSALLQPGAILIGT